MFAIISYNMMKNKNLNTTNSRLLILCGLALFLVNFFPIWRIELGAPQYPEGLLLFIHSSKLSGNVDIINGLNHYIGMKKLDAADFVEFSVLPYLIVFFSVAFVAAGLLARRSVAYIVMGLFVAFGILAMVDFWRWEYDYGHNLDPNAAIIVPGMAYQPPLIGFKQLLNFGAYSIPAIGGWIFVSVGIIGAYCVINDWYTVRKKSKLSGTTQVLVGTLVFCLSFTGIQACGSKEPEQIRIGVDACLHCKMTISDERFGCELVTHKGRTYKFDDLACMSAYIIEGSEKKEDVKNYYVADFESPNQLRPAADVLIIRSEKVKSPMGGNYLSFNKTEYKNKIPAQFPGDIVTWETLFK